MPTFETDGIPRRVIQGGICVGAILVFSVTPYGKGLGMRFYIPLSIAFFTLLYFIGKIESSQRRFVFVLAILMNILIVVVIAFIPVKSYFLDIVTKLTLLCAILIIPLVFIKKDGRSVLNEYARFISLAIVLGAFILSLTYSAKRLTFAYDSVWSPVSL